MVDSRSPARSRGLREGDLRLPPIGNVAAAAVASARIAPAGLYTGREDGLDPPEGRRVKILVADDDATLRSGLRELLEEDGHQVVTASDGGEAMRLIDRETFDVALLDLRMPKASGIEVLHRLRASQPGAAAVMITGTGTIDAAVEAMKAGAVDFVEKPYEVETLRRTLRAVEEERSARRTLSGSWSGPAAGPILSEAAARGALLAVLGPAGTPPSGAARVLRIDTESRPPSVFAPRQLYALNVAIEEHVKEAERPVVYAADLTMLETTHGRADVLAWIRHVSGKCGAKGGTLVLGRVDPALAAEVTADLTADVPSSGTCSRPVPSRTPRS